MTGASNNWNTDGDYNWFNGQSLLFPFHPNDDVIFDDTGSASPAVNLVGSLQPASVTCDAAQDYVFSGSGSLGGTMTLTKAGTGTLTLGTTNDYTGATTVSNGTLLVNGSLNQSLVTVQSGGIVGGNGRLGIAPALLSGAGVAPGNGIGGAGTLTIAGALTESGGINNYFDLSDDPTGLVKTNDQIIVVGALNVSGRNFIRVNLLDGPLANGLYPLIKYGSFAGSLTNFVLINANGVLTNPPGEIAIYVNSVRLPGNLKWVGNGVNNTWDDGLTTNWLNGASPDAFHFFDTVLFDDSGSANPPVNLAGSLTPASLTVNATQDYTFSGTGKISGYGTLTKTNSGTLTILSTNDYAGPTVIAGGALAVVQLANGGLPCALGAADGSPGNLILSGGTLRYTGASVSTDRGLTLDPVGGTIDVSAGTTTLTLSNTITGTGLLTKTGKGQLAFAGANDFSGGVVVTAGSVRLDNNAGFSTDAVTLNGGTNGATLQFGINAGTLNNPLNIVGTNNFTVNNVNNTVTTMTGSGTLTLNTGTTFTFGGDMSDFSGTIKVGTVINPRFNGSTGSSNAIFDLGNTFATNNTRNGGVTIQLGALFGGPNTLLRGAESADNPTTYVIGGKNLDCLFAGKITERAALRTVNIVKAGTGVFTLTGANTYTGTTTVNGGALLVNNTTGSGTGTNNSVMVNDGGILGGTGFIASAVTVNAGGALAPGSNGVGTLTLKSNLTLNAGANLNFELGAAGTGDRIAVSNALVLGGSLNVTNLPGFGPGTNIILTCGGPLSGSLTVGQMPAGYAGVILTNPPGQVRLAVSVSARPGFSGIANTAAGLVFNGDGGTARGTYYLLASTNVALPLTGWKRVQTNSFGEDGSFIFTNAMDANVPQSFYRLQVP